MLATDRVAVLSPVYTIQPVVKPVERTVAVRSTGFLTTGWMFVYTIQPVVRPVLQPVVSCKRGFNLQDVENMLTITYAELR